MQTLSFREVREILDLIDESTASEVNLRIGDLTLQVKRRGGDVSGHAAQTPSPPSAVARTAGDPPAPAAAISPPTAAAPVAKTSDGPEGSIAVRAPLAGIFYRAPAPGEPPFVEVGQKVVANTDICIIEVMKVMNNVKAGIAGVVVAIVADNEAAVEYRAPLVWIRPEA